MNLVTLDKQFIKSESTVFDSGNIDSFKRQFSDLASIEYTADMVAREEQNLLRDKQSTENLKKLKPIIFERQKLFTERYKLILECIQNGFKNEQERTQLTIEFCNAYNELKKVLSKLYFGLDSNAKQVNSYMSAYRR